MSTNSNSNGGGITFLGALQVLFIGLKLANVIDWPWHMVLAPIIFWIIAVVIAILIVIGSGK